MNVADAVQLYAYNRWANSQILEASSELSEEQLHRDLKTSNTSVFGTLQHILWGEWRWLGRWQSSPPPGADPLTVARLTDLSERWAEVEAARTEFLAKLRDLDLARLASYENPPGKSWTYALGHMLQHVVNHSTYHRGQVAALFRQLGEQPRPTDYLVFFDVNPGAR
jgi:uncharacterized damage-inducible protein DinB